MVNTKKNSVSHVFIFLQLYCQFISFICQTDKYGSKKVMVVVASIVSSIIAMLVVLKFVYWRNKTKFRSEGNLSKRADSLFTIITF